jgi:methionine sulfoxide reductase heme-binding subunit
VSQLLHDRALLWYVSRATGVVCLLLLTLTLLLGILATTRVSSAGWPRFVTQGLHRNISLFVLVLLAVHITSVVGDDYVPITPRDAVVPFVSAYRPFWLGLGVVAVELLVALVVTSLVRQRLGYGTWRAVHWASYLCWPLALVHGLGTGSDPRRGWATGLAVCCAAAVLAAVGWRIVEGWPRRATMRLGAVLLAAGAVATVVVWARQGPLAPGWSKRAGTPPAPATEHR